MGLVALVLFLGFPAVAIGLARRSKVLEALGPVVLCYAFGIILGNTLISPDSPGAETADLTTTVTVALAIPLLLFSTDFRAWLRLARPTIISFGLAIVSIVVVASTAAQIFDLGVDPAAVAGMTVGVYTGGTANMAAIGTALDVPDATFVALNGADVLVSSVYLLALFSVLPRALARILPRFRSANELDQPRVETDAHTERAEMTASESPDPTEEDPFSVRPPARAVAAGLGTALVVVLVAGAVGYALASLAGDGSEPVLDSDLFASTVILSITTLGIAASFVTRIRDMEGTYATGQYLFLVFATAIGTLANLGELADSLGSVVPYIGIALLGAIVLHIVAAAVFRIDRDTVMITSTAAVFGPPFVGPVAGVLKNREIVVSGLTTGVVGLAVGNYVGLGVAYLLGA